MVHYEHFLGQTFGDRYTAVSIIGTGESSAVFGVYDQKTEQTVALKLLSPDCYEDDEATTRFLDEIAVLSLFDHPNIVKILDTSLDGEYKFFVMEYIEGITLKKHILTKGALSEEEILFLSRPILSALGEVHKKGVIHCDIKPQNVVLVGSGEIKLMDFGISRRLDGQSEEVDSVTVGTVQYVSPEQAEGKLLSPASDLYSFGITLYEMATGVLPFVDNDQSRIAAMQVSSQPIPPRLVGDNVSPELDALILHIMEKDPDARPQSAAELLSLLENLHTPHESEETAPQTPSLLDFFKNLDPRSLFAGVLSALLLSVVICLGILLANVADQRKNEAYIRIPDLVGEIYTSPEGLGLDESLYKISVEYTWSTKKNGKILSQSPAGGRVVRRGDEPIEIRLRAVLYTLPELMPNVTCLPLEDAAAYLDRYGCELEIVYVEHDYLPYGYVTKTEPAAGEAASKKITLYISKNKSE